MQLEYASSAHNVQRAHNEHIQTITDLLEQAAVQVASQNARAIEQDERVRELEQRMLAGFTGVESQFRQRHDDTEGAFSTENWVGEAQLAEDLKETHRWWRVEENGWETA